MIQKKVNVKNNKKKEEDKKEEENKFHCEKCKFICHENQDLQRHILREHLRLDNNINQSTDEHDLQKMKNEEKVINEKKETLLCEKCSYRTRSESTLKRHHELNHKIYKCNQCEKKYKTENWLKKHMKSVHEKYE